MNPAVSKGRLFGLLVLGSLILGAVVLACAHLPAHQRASIALLPFANFTEIQDAPDIVMPLVAEALETRGFKVVSGRPLEEVLYSYRVRHTTMLGRKTAEALATELGVDGVMVGMVSLTLVEKVPQMGISARLLSLPDAEVLWAQDVSLAGEDFTGPLGLGTVKSLDVLSARAVHRLLASLKPRLERQVVPPSEPPGFLSFLGRSETTTLFRDQRVDFYGVESLGVLPFLNASGRPNAGDVITALFVSALHNSGKFRVVEPGIVRDVFLRFRIRSVGTIDRFSLLSLNRNMNAQGYLLGAVYEFVEGKGLVTSPPSVAVSARMVRGEDGKVVWSMEHGRRGDDFNLVLDFDRIYSIIPLARLTVAEMVHTFSGS
jgi:TolB-like protein